MFDIDNFKQFNDLYGHAAGDDILIQVVKLMRSVIRPTDKVCRIGGDEFVVIFWEPTGPRTATSRPPSDIYALAQRFQSEIANHKFPKLGREAPGALTISGGLATYPWDGANAAALLAQADELSLQSKRQGKNAIALGPGAEREHGGN
jgi:diguanylate cyclase (GGDEF)-like protein